MSFITSEVLVEYVLAPLFVGILLALFQHWLDRR